MLLLLLRICYSQSLLNFIIINYFTVEKLKDRGRERKMGAVQCGVCKAAVFHLDSESVKEKKKISTLIPLFHVPAIRLACIPCLTPGWQWKFPW